MPQNWGGSGWQVIEEDSYERAIAQGGSYEFFDEALAPIEYALHRNPLGFPAVPGFRDVHLAKTKLRIFGPEVIPSYRLWFRVDEDRRTVHKLWVEIAPPEDMGIGESFCDEDDDLPF